MTTEAARLHLHDRARAAMDDDAANTLMGSLPWKVDDLATKRDLDDLATKGDLEELRIATRQDLAEMRAATKQDLADLRVATREDLAATREDLAELRVATKQDFADLRVAAQRDYEVIAARIDAIGARIVAKVIGFVIALNASIAGIAAVVSLR